MTRRGRLRGAVAAVVGALLLTGLPASAGAAADAASGVVLTGRVTDESGAPVEGMVVTDQQSWATDVTDNDGRYELSGLSATASAAVDFSDPELFRYVRQFHRLYTPASTTLDVTVQLGGVITGTITDADGVGFPSAVDLAEPGMDTTVRYDHAGGYSMLVSPGEHVVEFLGAAWDGIAPEYYDDAQSIDDATPITVAAGQTVSGIDAVLEAGVSVSGSVVDQFGDPAGGVSLSLTRCYRSGSTSRCIGHPGQWRTATDGTFTIIGVRPGEYTLWLHDPTLTVLSENTTLSVPAEGVTNARYELVRGGLVTGRLDGPSGEGTYDNTWLHPVSGRYDLKLDRSTGQYRLLLSPGEHVLKAEVPGFLPEYYDDATTLDGARTLRVAAGDVLSGIDIELSRGSSLTGVVTDTAGRPIPNVNVSVTSGDWSSSDWSRQWGRTDANGRYSVAGLRGGPSEVCAEAEGYVSRGPERRPCHNGATVDLPDGGSLTLGLVLPRPTTVSGVVTGPRGEPVAGVDVTLGADGGYQHAETAADGRYTIEGVAPGSFSLHFGGTGTYGSQAYDWVAPWTSAAPTPLVVTEATPVDVDAQLWAADLSHVFTDVPWNHPFVREIAWMKANGISTGNANGTYGPTASVTREAMAAFLYRMKGRPAYTAPRTSPFRDVAVTHPFYKEICWLASTGITTGWPDGTFRPGLAVERQAMAAFLYRFAGKPAFTPPATSPFRDVRTTDPFYKEIAWLASVGVAGGYTDGGYRPTAAVDRQAMAAFLNRLDRKVLP